jgi:hypothetical protein
MIQFLVVTFFIIQTTLLFVITIVPTPTIADISLFWVEQFSIIPSGCSGNPIGSVSGTGIDKICIRQGTIAYKLDCSAGTHSTYLTNTQCHGIPEIQFPLNTCLYSTTIPRMLFL